MDSNNTRVETPEPGSRKRKAPAITAGQKQALMDNLQLEVTERARKLRAQYALHAQHLRSRLELRVQRIPQSVKSATIEGLIDKYASRQAPSKTSKASGASKNPKILASPARPHVKKRMSNDMSSNGDDKENTDMNLDLPRKRGNNKATSTQDGRATSRKIVPSTVLSPKSSNSRTLPRSPIKPSTSSPQKPYASRAASPLKSTAAASATENRAASRAASRVGNHAARPATATGTRGKKTATTSTKARGPSNGSTVSDSSSGTTIVKKKAPAPKKTAATKTTAATRGKATLKKDTTAAQTTSAGGRVLRSRR